MKGISSKIKNNLEYCMKGISPKTKSNPYIPHISIDQLTLKHGKDSPNK